MRFDPSKRRFIYTACSLGLGGAALPLLGACGAGSTTGDAASSDDEFPGTPPDDAPDGGGPNDPIPADDATSDTAAIPENDLPEISQTSLHRLRGAQLGEFQPWTDPDYTGWSRMESFPQWGGNAVRLFIGPFAPDGTRLHPGQPLSAGIGSSVDSWGEVINWCLARRVHVVLAFLPSFPWPVVRHWPEDDGRSLWLDTSVQDELVDAWTSVAERFRYRHGIAFDLINEPHAITELEQGLENDVLNILYPRIVDAIRAIDPNRWVVLESVWGALHEVPALSFIDDPRLLYSAHVYEPHYFTHQGIGIFPAGPVSYPSVTQEASWEPAILWDVSELRARLQPVRNFEMRTGARILIGEFGCTQAAPPPSRAAWTADCYALFEEYGWDSLHFRYEAGAEIVGWTLERSEIEETCKAYFSLNKV